MAFSIVLQEAVCLDLSWSCGRAPRDTSAWKELHITKSTWFCAVGDGSEYLKTDRSWLI